MKKYVFTGQPKEMANTVVKRIMAIREIDLGFKTIKPGETGGWLEKEENLSHEGNCWVMDEACVTGNICVMGDTCIMENTWIAENDQILVLDFIGSRHESTTFYNKDGEIEVSCGSFRGTLAGFEAEVQKTHGDNKYAREYRAAIELAKTYIKTEAQS